MASSNNQSSGTEPEPEANLQDLIQGLSFQPKWGGGSDGSGSLGTGGGAGSREQRPSGRSARGAGRAERSGRGTSGRRGAGSDRRPARGFPEAQSRPLPVEVSFIPERDRLGAVVRKLHALKRAFPLPYLAGLFLDRPEHHLVKLEARSGDKDPPLQFYQDRVSRSVFFSESALREHLVKAHLDKHYEREEVRVDPPVGNYVCVGLCRRSGVIIGPPNHHGYNERLLEIHRTHFPQVALDEYRKSIDVVRDPGVLERWREESCMQVRYRAKGEPAGSETLTLLQAASAFMELHANAYVHVGAKVTLPGQLAGEIDDARLRQAVSMAWRREQRFPFSMMLALRPAFRRMGLHLFKVGREETYITAIVPKSLDSTHAIPAIKSMVQLISDHPGCRRAELLGHLCPGKPGDDPAVVEALRSLAWLVDKGHIIEYFNATYAVPGHLKIPIAGTAPDLTPEEIPVSGENDVDAAPVSTALSDAGQTEEV